MPVHLRRSRSRRPLPSLVARRSSPRRPVAVRFSRDAGPVNVALLSTFRATPDASEERRLGARATAGVAARRSGLSSVRTGLADDRKSRNEITNGWRGRARQPLGASCARQLGSCNLIPFATYKRAPVAAPYKSKNMKPRLNCNLRPNGARCARANHTHCLSPGMPGTWTRLLSLLEGVSVR